MAKRTDLVENENEELELIGEQPTPVVFRDNYKVAQTNELILAKQDSLSTTETMLIKLIEAQIAKGSEDLLTYTCSASELASYLGVDRTALYRDLKLLAQSWGKKQIFWETPGRGQKSNWVLMPWFSLFSYVDGTVTIKLNENLRPYLTGLERGGFATYLLGSARRIKNPRAIRLLEILKSYENVEYKCPNPTAEPLKKSEIVLVIDHLKDIMGLGERYEKNADFVAKVIAPAVDLITENHEMMVTYRVLKQGRKVEFIVFNLRDEDAFSPEEWFAGKIKVSVSGVKNASKTAPTSAQNNGGNTGNSSSIHRSESMKMKGEIKEKIDPMLQSALRKSAAVRFIREHDLDSLMPTESAWIMNIIISFLMASQAKDQWQEEVWNGIESIEDCDVKFAKESAFRKAEKVFTEIYARYHSMGLFRAPDEVLLAAEWWDAKLGLQEIENIK